MDRAAGVLVGLATGDALGAGYEFTHPDKDAEVCMKGGGSFGWKPGEWTDDTQMAIYIARCAAKGYLDELEVGQCFLDWYASNPPDVGVQTSKVLGGALTPADLFDRARAAFEDSGGEGNGSLMRTAPVALAYLDDEQAAFEAAMRISALTHAGPDSTEACGLWTVAIVRAVSEGRGRGGPGKSLEGHLLHALRYIVIEDRKAIWEERIQAAVQGPITGFPKNGWVVHAFQAAIAAIVHTPVPEVCPSTHLSAALKAAVRVGGDTDTVAAIAGGFLGAYWGLTAIPIGAAKELNGLPADSTSVDLVRWASLAALGGESDNSGWPAADRLLPHYAGKERGRWVALKEEPNLICGDVLALEKLGDEFEADIVVSLCRIGPADVPTGVEHHVVRMLDYADPENNPNLEWELLDLAFTLDRWTKKSRKVFLHCVGANSRTPTAAAAFIAFRDGVSGRSALASMTSQLGSQWHNSYFVDLLHGMFPDCHPQTPLWHSTWNRARLSCSRNHP
jgi:ADP-ribosyl-[dinitrogen reductase] hydrolase